MAGVKFLDDKRAMVEKALARFFPPDQSYPQIIHKAVRHSLFSGGKRFRPVLVLLTAETFGSNPKDVLPTACAIEYVHTYSLIHDDLPAIDNDELRRGQPTCHVVFGEDVAILAGDALFAEAFYLIGALQKNKDPNRVVQVIQELALAAGVRGMVGGQVVDILSTGKKVDSSTLDFIHAHKTGRLIAVAARCGAILSGVTDAELKTVTDYAEYLGLAFQIVDDVLDVVGEEKLLGKKVGSDSRQEKATFVGSFGVDKSRKFAKEAVEKSKEYLNKLEQDTKLLADLAQFVYERES